MTAEQDALDIPAPPAVADPLAGLTPGQRLRHRQNAQWAAGNHPLGYATRLLIPLHIDATRDPGSAILEDRVRCGTCTHRIAIRGGARVYHKCDARGGQRITHGPGTDVLANWPGCTNWNPIEDGA